MGQSHPGRPLLQPVKSFRGREPLWREGMAGNAELVQRCLLSRGRRSGTRAHCEWRWVLQRVYASSVAAPGAPTLEIVERPIGAAFCRVTGSQALASASSEWMRRERCVAMTGDASPTR